MNKIYFVIDDCTTRRAMIWEIPLDPDDRDEAIREALESWDRMSDHDKRDRDSYSLIYAALADENCIDWDTAETVLVLK